MIAVSELRMPPRTTWTRYREDNLITDAHIPFPDSVPSSRDRSLEARVVRGIETGDELEPANPHLAALFELIEKTKAAEGYKSAAGGDPRLRALDILTDAKQHLRTLDREAYVAAVRKPLAAALDIPLRELDAIRDKQRRGYRVAAGDEDELPGQALEWPEPEAWPDPVDGAALLAGIAATIRRHVYAPAGAVDSVVLWAAMTWIHPRLDISPFLILTSPTKRCGKSLLLEIVAEFVHRPFPTSNATPAALFRTIEQDAPTLLLDEADRAFAGPQANPELTGIINSSQRRRLAAVTRCVGDNHEPRRFVTWCPKALAGIGELPDTIIDRSVVIHMERKPSSVRLPGWRDRDRAEIERLRRQLARWTNDHAGQILEARRRLAFPSGLKDRARDGWEALLAIGEVAYGEWAGDGGRAWAACEHVSARGDGAPDDGELLVLDMHQVFTEAGDPDALPTSRVLGALHEMEDRPWGDWKGRGPMKAQTLAFLLKRFGVRPQDVWVAEQEKVLKGYKRETFAYIWEQYGAVEAARSREPRAAIDDFADSGSRGEMNASRPENPEKAPPVLDSSRPRDLKRGIGLWRWKKSRYG